MIENNVMIKPMKWLVIVLPTSISKNVKKNRNKAAILLMMNNHKTILLEVHQSGQTLERS